MDIFYLKTINMIEVQHFCSNADPDIGGGGNIVWAWVEVKRAGARVKGPFLFKIKVR